MLDQLHDGLLRPIKFDPATDVLALDRCVGAK